MLQRTPPPAQRPLPPRATRWIWLVAAMNCLNVAWVTAAGAWFDRQDRWLATATWGGHHRLVLGLAVAALAGFGLLVPVTAGFTRATRLQEGIIAVTVFAALVAIGGVMAVAVPVVVVVMLAGLVLWALR